ncbi:MAG: SDR family NAD(P)-dependent oxidoreductase [Candidatus Caenarcaniphilales bacterium]|nr:SDR family NAD(P)-dependent oxidoreductase [Candidatus Caenarcaniphilales bacterium]
MTKSILVIGAGKGVSHAVAREFGKQGFQVGLLGRNPEKLNALKEELEHDGIYTKCFQGDVGEEESLRTALQKVKLEFDSIDIIHYNAASPRSLNILEETSTALVADFKVNVIGLLVSAQELLPELEKAKGAILVTGGGFAIYPHPDFGSLSIGKAGLRNLSESLAQALRSKGIYLGIVSILGMVSPDDSVHNPQNIAAKFWSIYQSRQELEFRL